MMDEDCAGILESVEDYIETQEPGYDPETRWAGGWRVGRTSRHVDRIREKARSALPGWVVARADAYYKQEESKETS